MYHYTYLIEYKDSLLYMGVRSSSNPPLVDGYYGSLKGFRTLAARDLVKRKIILGIYNTRQEAYEAEILYHTKHRVDKNPRYRNRARSTSSAFTCNNKGELNGMFGKQRSAESKRKALETKKANDSFTTDKTVYVFKHKLSGMLFTGQRRDFYTIFNICRKNLHACITGKQKSIQGWECLSHKPKTKAEPGRLDKNIYTFSNTKLNITATLTRSEFRVTFQLDRNKIADLIKGKRQMYNDWCILNLN